MILKQIFCEITNVCPLAWEAFVKTATLAITMLLCALMMTFYGQEHGFSSELLHIIFGLIEAPAGLFLIATIGVIFIQRAHDAS